MTIHISSAFDGGNIDVQSIDGTTINLHIRRDRESEFAQWFHFRVTGAADQALTIRITNIADTAYVDGWPDYQARVTEDREEWRQAETSTTKDALTIHYTPETNSAWFAYFAPYSMERHHDLIAWAACQPGVGLELLGETLEGRPMDCIHVGTGPKQVWLYARQHPGETMAEWWMEGALERLLDEEDSVARALRQKATFHVVPNMNPDGSYRGHLRTNYAGVNLNREWHEPTAGRSPEVLCVRNAMDRTGVDFAMDVHGDEAIPAVFIAGFEGIPSHSAAKQALFDKYKNLLAARTPDFQTAKGYPVSADGKANLSMSTNQVAERFGAVSMTLEMPFKDNDDCPDPDHGWSPARSMQLGKDCLSVLAEMIDEI